MSYQRFSEYHDRRNEQETVSHAMVMCETLARLNVDPKSFVNNVCLPVLLENQFANDKEFVGLLGKKFCEVAEIYGMGLNENMWKNMLGKLTGLGGDESTMAGMANAGRRRPPANPDVQQKAHAIATFINDHLRDMMGMLGKRFQQNGDVVGQRVLAGVQKKIGSMMNNIRFVGGDDLGASAANQANPVAAANGPQAMSRSGGPAQLAGGGNAMTGSFLKRNVMGNAKNPKLVQNLLAHAAGNRGGLPQAPSKAAPAPVAAKAMGGGRNSVNTNDVGGGSVADMMKKFGMGGGAGDEGGGVFGDFGDGEDLGNTLSPRDMAQKQRAKAIALRQSREKGNAPEAPQGGKAAGMNRKAAAQERILQQGVNREKSAKDTEGQVNAGNFQKKGQKKGQKKEQKKEQRKEQQKESMDYSLCESLINMAMRTSNRPCWGV